ncbi:hypothetical protein J437_LFUL007428 [Ladona fulva]|uniref:C2H2-type domain-containing protein n=1 Tax=Ladona fulva TaxID=123851 RepID=A0A8K0NYU0_LADFU|nr:hypothetical protein J437_LFUL007428 [Ladona fulva]
MNDIQNVDQAVVISKLNQKEFQCPQCCKSFRFRRHYDKHLEGHKHNDCKHCDKLFTVRKKLVVHLLEEHGIKLQDFKHNCRFCEKVFAKKISLYQHLQIHVIGKNVCLQCGRIFPDHSEFQKHQDKHRLAKSWKCDECDEKFSRRQQYMMHIQDHGKYKCITCNKSFSARTKLAEHKRKGHRISELEPNYVCLKCEKSFHRSRALVLHQRVHQGGKSSEEKGSCCNNVIYKGSQSKHLDDDGEIGFKERVKFKKKSDSVKSSNVCVVDEKDVSEMYKTQVQDEKVAEKCIYCDYESSSKANMKRHLEFHIEERKFVCECCGASFYMLSTLKEHFLYVHSEKRNFPCPQCDKSFKRKSGLNRHLRDHSESRPFACNCGQFYKRKSHLLRHQESSHGLVSQPKKLCKLRRNESGILVPIEEETHLKYKSKAVKSPVNKKDEIEGDVVFKHVHGIERDQLSICKEYDEISLNRQSIKTCIISEKALVNKEVVKEVSVDQGKNCYKNEEVVGVSNGRVDSPQVHILQGDAKGLPEVDKSEYIKLTASQKPVINSEMGYILESISSNQSILQNNRVALKDQVISHPSSCVVHLVQDPPDQLSIVDLVQFVTHDVLISGENTVFCVFPPI